MFWSNSSKDEETTVPDEHLFSNQSKMISNALKQADRAMKQATYAFNTKGMTTIDESRNEELMRGEESFTLDDTTESTVKTGVETRTRNSSDSTRQSLDLRRNDIQFQIIADIIISKYEHLLRSGATSFSVSLADKQQLDRMVSRDSFVEAVKFRLHSCPENSQEAIHIVTRKCRALGLHRSGHQNLLYAPAGTVLQIERGWESGNENPHQSRGILSDSSTYTSASGDIGKQQLLAELKEASNLMAASVTPEAAQFWRQHVVDLQTRLRNFRDKPESTNTFSTRENQKRFTPSVQRRSGLRENTGYIAPAPKDESTDPTPLDQTRQKSVRSGSEDYRQRDDIESTGSTKDSERQGLPMVEVVSPANLPEGYTFEAEIDGCRFMATVPPGGVRKGQTFSCYMRDVDKIDQDIPVGRWRDDLFSSSKHGMSHPMFLNSFICPLIALSQVMTRMGVDYMGLPAPDIPRNGLWSTTGMTTTILVCWTMLNTVIIAGLHYKFTRGISVSVGDIAAFSLVNLAMYIYIVYAAANTRWLIREKYSIKASFCGDIEDTMVTAACMPCAISQMGRHTVSYERHKGICCSDTGLEPGVEGDITTRKHVGSYRIW